MMFLTNSKPLVSPSDPASLSPMEFLKYSQTPSGSKRIQPLLSSGDANLKARIIQSAVLSDLEEMSSCPLSCKVVQKLISCLDPDIRELLAILIIKQFSDVDLHPLDHQAVVALLAVGSQDQRDMGHLPAGEGGNPAGPAQGQAGLIGCAASDSFKYCYQFGRLGLIL